MIFCLLVGVIGASILCLSFYSAWNNGARWSLLLILPALLFSLFPTFLFAARQVQFLLSLQHDLAVVTEGSQRVDSSDDDPEMNMTQGDRIRAALAAIELSDDEERRGRG